MNENEAALCRDIFNELKSKKVFNLFWKSTQDLTNPNIIHPINFETISTKLDHNLYDSVGDFLSDITVCIENGKNGYPEGTIRNAAAHQLYSYFEEILTQVNPFCGGIGMPLQYITKKFASELTPPTEQTNIIIEKHNEDPGSVLFGEESDPDNLDILYRDIKLLSSTTLAFEFAAYVKRLQPDAIAVGNEITVNITLLQPENRPLMRRYVTNLLKRAAQGEVDAYARPFGQKIEPLRIYERGFSAANSSSK